MRHKRPNVDVRNTQSALRHPIPNPKIETDLQEVMQGHLHQTQAAGIGKQDKRERTGGETDLGMERSEPGEV